MNEIKSVQLNPIYTPTLVKIQNPEVELEPVNSFCEDKPQSQIEKKYGGDEEDKISEFFPGFMPSQKYMIDSQDRSKYLISKEKYKILCEEGKINSPNQYILDELKYENNKKEIELEIKERLQKSIIEIQLVKNSKFSNGDREKDLIYNRMSKFSEYKKLNYEEQNYNSNYFKESKNEIMKEKFSNFSFLDNLLKSFDEVNLEKKKGNYYFFLFF